MVDILVIPDAHTKPGISNERFDQASRLIIDRQPEVIVCIGDLFDFGSLSSYDKGKKSAENQRFVEDLKAGIDALERLFSEIHKYNKSRSRKYQPRFVFCRGNHEERLARFVEDNANMEDFVSFDDMKLKEFGWEVVPFKETIEIEGVLFSHFFPGGLMDRPTSSARATLNKWHKSCISGHRHDLDVALSALPNGDKIWAISAGCFLAEDQIEHYVSKTIQKTWWKGLIMLNDVQNGQFDLETISLSRLKEKYA